MAFTEYERASILYEKIANQRGIAMCVCVCIERDNRKRKIEK